MKKTALVITILLCVFLSSCTTNVSTNIIDKPSKDNDIAQDSTSSKENYNAQDLESLYPLAYDTLTDMSYFISPDNEEKIYDQFSKEGVEEKTIVNVKMFIKKIQSENNIVPYLNSNPIEFRNKEGYSNILLVASETFKLPWIFYYPVVSTEANFYIKITYLPDSIFENNNAPTASEAIKELSPNSPNVDNLGEQHKKIYNKMIRLSDREVTALICEYKTDSRNSTFIVYDDMLVEIRSDPEIWDEEWFTSLSFGGFQR